MYLHVEESERYKFAPQFPKELKRDVNSDLLGATEKEAEECMSKTLSLRLSKNLDWIWFVVICSVVLLKS